MSPKFYTHIASDWLEFECGEIQSTQPHDELLALANAILNNKIDNTDFKYLPFTMYIDSTNSFLNPKYNEPTPLRDELLELANEVLRGETRSNLESSSIILD